MKEDPMKNGQLKSGYNIKISTKTQVILRYSILQKPNNTICLIPHLEKIKENLDGVIPQNTVVNTGYESAIINNNLISYIQ